MRISTVVGYQAKDLAAGKQAIATGFIRIGTDGAPGIYLTDMIPTCTKSDGNIIIEMLDAYGVAKTETLEVYSYYKNSLGNTDGWWDYDDNEVGEDIPDVFFPVGTGLWVTGMNGTTWNSNGQVFTADKSIPLANGKQMISNPYATSIFLARDIVIGNCAKSDGNIIIEMLDSYGVAKTETLEVYSWYKNSLGNTDGWWDYDDNEVGEDIPDVEFEAGQGLWVTGLKDATFDITSPIVVE